MRPLQNSKGTTLVELMVSITLLAILSLAATTLIAPCVKAYVTVQQQTRAQTLADALVENLRLELETAAGELCFVNADTNSDTVYQSLVTNEKPRPAQGSALQYSVYPSHIALLDAGAVPELKMKQPDGTGKEVLSGDKAKERAGYLHMRYYSTEQAPQDTKNGFVYGFTDIYAKGAYMDMKVGSLQFYARGWQTGADGKPHLTSLTVVLTIVSEKDAATVLCTQKAIIPLPGKPAYSAAPLLKATT
ncbi:type II secretion system protein [uncultured Gemmiger sp.]|uniref:PilW family protein n=1 Tax=uncultured Gemmiger sp. TaxID=1623490 RepID=UPI0027DC973A|nr:type II secretion system protein [uncultured Gemmiger sp.]